MTPIIGAAVLLLAVGIVGAVVKRLFRLAMMLAIFVLLLLGGAIYVIGHMR